MANITEFLFNGDVVIRTEMINDQPWFVAQDLCDALGYAKARNAIRMHIDEKDALIRGTLTKGGMQQMLWVNESGLYALIFSSQLPAAKEFKYWVTSEVLPSLRKQGSYRMKDVPAEEAKIAERSSLIDVLDCNEKTARQQGNDAGAMLFDMLNNRSVTCAAVFEELKAFINNVTILRNLDPQLQRLFLYSFAASLRYEALCCDARKEQLLKIESIFEELSTISKDKELNREYRQKASDRLFKRLVKAINEAEKEISELILPYSLMKKGGAE
ncbi:BRO-N domain-containing protein [Succinatimonas hippei]|uniref:BRO-N domain-containing protein n=1 Tax=Succinatimonas hippei TaxID=626938 RepID=UPI0023F7A46A|nr:BRO family protein [Succinatimonas hippei]